ncbi:MAG: asparagine synthase-related protein, partial [Terriglobia bacterium]
AWVKDGQSVRHVPYRDLRNGFSGTGVRLAPQALAACLRDSLARENAFPHLGIMFSGGLDSTYIAAALHRTDLVLYSIGFPGIGAVDLEAAEREAAILRLPLKRVHVDRRGFADRLPAAIRHFGWPIDHPNFVARDILFEQAQADGIDRLLSGDGSDTVFGGAWYVALHKALLLKRWVPSIARFAPPIHHRLRYISHILETPVEDLILFDKTYYPQSVARAFAQDAGDFAEHLRAQLRPVAGWDPLDQAFYIAHLTTLSIYPSAQRGMAWYWDDDVGYPFLNERVVRLAQSVAGRAKVRGFVAKRIFLPVAAAAVSRQTMARRKYGLPVPFEDFIFGPGGMFRYQD